MADSLTRPSVDLAITPEQIEQNPQVLSDWIFSVAQWIKLANDQGMDLKGNVVDGEIFLNDLPTVAGSVGSLYRTVGGNIKIVL